MQYDKQWEEDPSFEFYDFNHPENINAKYHGAFDLLIMDPPFITEDVWRKYALAAEKLLKRDAQTGAITGRVLCTTISENKELLTSLFPGLVACTWRPMIPNLVYQYEAFTTCSPVPTALAALNPEVDFEY